jgi:hypothetical protein
LILLNFYPYDNPRQEIFQQKETLIYARWVSVRVWSASQNGFPQST